MRRDGVDSKHERAFEMAGILCAGMILLLAAAAEGAAASPQVGKPGATAMTSCEELWREAGTGSATDALAKAKVAAGPAPSAAANGWMSGWTGAWNSAWTMPLGALTHAPGQDCCDTNWFERAAETGKASWEKAWSAASKLAGADQSWADKFAKAYADAWAKDWFERFPWLCARARANAWAKKFKTKSETILEFEWAWAMAAASAKALAEARTESWTKVWTEAGASAWAAAGASAVAEAAASARSSAMAAASGNCAISRAASCADAAAAAYAAAWAEAGSKAYAAAFAEAWATASAYALARAWALAMTESEAVAWADAWAYAYAEAGARAWAAVWRVALADKGQLDAIAGWWKSPGAGKPALQTIWKLLAADSAKAFKKASEFAWATALAQSSAAAARFREAEAEAKVEMISFATSWVNTWTQSWAYAWAEAWARAYAMMCSRAAAAACVDCRPCVPTIGVTRASSIGYVITGAGVTAGTIFTIGLRNSTSEPVKVGIPGGTLFQPSTPDHQRMITDLDREVEVPPNGSATLPITGYCLDPGLQAPPATTLGRQTDDQPYPVLASLDPLDSLSRLPLKMASVRTSSDQAGATVKYQMLDPADAGPGFALFKKIIDAGNKLFAEGIFHTDMPPEKYKTTVIQRAIWTFATKGSAQPHSKETLLNDLRKQVKDTGGSQSEADMQSLVDHLWEDIEATLKASGV